jgi:hypothetical protein
MTRDAAIQTARTLAGEKGWPWVEPLMVEDGRRFIVFGRRFWRVTTNSQYADIGCNVHVQIDDQTGRVLSSDYAPTQTFNARAIL